MSDDNDVMTNVRGNYFAALPARVPTEALDTVRAKAPEALRWFHADDLHLTLAFFGREDPERLPAVREVLAAISFHELDVTLGALLLLPNPRRFRALSFELRDGHGAIADLIAQWRAPLLEAAGCRPDDRPPLPHLTIARPARKHPAFRAGEIMRWAKSLEPPTAPVRILPPVLYGWSAERPARQFQIIT